MGRCTKFIAGLHASHAQVLVFRSSSIVGKPALSRPTPSISGKAAAGTSQIYSGNEYTLILMSRLCRQPKIELSQPSLRPLVDGEQRPVFLTLSRPSLTFFAGGLVRQLGRDGSNERGP